MNSLKSILKFSILQFLFWWLVHAVSRTLFIVYNQAYFKPIQLDNLIACYQYGIKLDWSMASYITMGSVFLFTVYLLYRKKIILNTLYFWNKLSIILQMLITIADAVVYSHWQTKLNPMAISFLKSPKEVMVSAGEDDHIILMSLTLIICTAIFFYLFQLAFKPIMIEVKNNDQKSTTLITTLIVMAILFLGIRGGWQLEPINQSSAYFSDKAIYNHTALNTTWNLMNKYVLMGNKKSDYISGSDSEAKYAIKTFYNKEEARYAITTIKKPNILFIILEGFTADVIGSLGGESGLTPSIDSLIKNGILWKNFYANGDRTYKGLPAILNGWPTRPIGSVTQDADQSILLPSIAKKLKTDQYNTSFYYGGESEFANIKSYLINSGFDRIVDIHDYPASLRGLKWGVSDHYVLGKMALDLDQITKPFFSAVLTLSTHEPYDIPIPPIIKGNNPADKFRNTVMYTDQSLNTFIHTIKSKPWYDSTLIIITADHGNHLPKNHQTNFEPARFKIPLLVFGGALLDSLKNKEVNTIASHNDIAYSILTALGYTGDDYHYSHQLFASNEQGAFYTFDNGYGMMTPASKYCFDYNSNKIIYKEGMVLDSLLTLGKLLMQATQSK